MNSQPISTETSASVSRDPGMSWQAWIVLTTILLVATVLRFFGLDREGFWGDEYLQTQQYLHPIHYTIWNGIARHAFGPPDFVIGWLAWRIDPSVWMCRFPSVLWGIAAVATTFAVVRRMATVRAGLVAAAILAVCPMHLVLSQEARPYSICAAFMLFTVLALQRAFERPDRFRLALYVLTAIVCSMTRSFIPCVFLAVIGGVISIANLSIVQRQFSIGQKQRVALRRTWWATMIAGVVSLLWVGVLLFALNRIPGTLQSALRSDGSSSSFVQNPYELDLTYLGQLTHNAAILLRTTFANLGPVVLVLSLVGGAMYLVRRQRLDIATVCLVPVLLSVGAAVIVVYGVVGGTHLFYDRYSFFMMPVGAILAAVGWSWLCESSFFRQNRSAAMVASSLLVLAAVAWPAWDSVSEAESYRRIDWRGCSSYLEPLIGSDDVVMTLTDAPFGRVQHRYFGKYEWSHGDRPLGESTWTMAISDSHFERLRNQSGNAYVVIVYPVKPQDAMAYLQVGIQQAPIGYELVKFRGLDLLIPQERMPNLSAQVLQACAMMSELPLEHDSAIAIPMTLAARLNAVAGRLDQQRHQLARARDLVPPAQQSLFEYGTSGWVN